MHTRFFFPLLILCLECDIADIMIASGAKQLSANEGLSAER